ncbi:MAG TPA: MFS transporter [Tepidisphaeraceae bacterium]|nr:MFS transporter [Tepidisphaeraceae bacterium]
MSQSLSHEMPSDRTYAKGFRPRRGLNWGSIGLMYASYYLCRYNFPIANPEIAKQYDFSNADMGKIISASMIAYAIGQMVNGFFTDRIGGRRAMMTGAIGTVLINVLFGFASIWGGEGTKNSLMLASFATIWGLNGYLQSFGAPGMIKINTSWFHKRERGRFAGIFGFMINLGRISANFLIPLILGGGTLFWFFHIQPNHWRWAFFVPAMITGLVALNFYIWVKNTPEETGFESPAKEASDNEPDPTLKVLFWTIFSNPVVWITALAYACTGVVRQGIDQWFYKYMNDVFNVNLKSPAFFALAFGIPIVATLGSLVSGVISDLVFKGKRAPVAGAMYLLETVIILCAAFFIVGTKSAVFFLILIAFTANATHSILGTAAAMDIGGKKMAGFASGVIDSFQYYGGFLAGWLLGYTIDHFGWGSYFYFMAPFGLIGAMLMFFARNKMNPKPPVAPPGMSDPSGFEVIPIAKSAPIQCPKCKAELVPEQLVQGKCPDCGEQLMHG